MATRSLSPKRALERMQQYRQAIRTLALQRAKQSVRANIRAKRQRIADFSAREITLLSEDYLTQHRDELIAESKHVIATSPYFVRWRLPPEVFEKNPKTEHSPNANSANSGVIVR
jgi:hypothetical protein